VYENLHEIVSLARRQRRLRPYTRSSETLRRKPHVTSSGYRLFACEPTPVLTPYPRLHSSGWADLLQIIYLDVVEWENDYQIMNWKGCGRNRSWSYLINLSRHFPGETEENYENLTHNSRSLGRYLNPRPSEYEAELLNHSTKTFGCCTLNLLQASKWEVKFESRLLMCPLAFHVTLFLSEHEHVCYCAWYYYFLVCTKDIVK
jgi:hypothetical protein